MHIARRLLLLSSLSVLGACARGPSTEEALAAIRAAHPALEHTDVHAVVWQDGPPWFSCAEVIAKFTTATDSAAVRDQVGNWKPLVVAGWIVLRDSASGPVADPGWCTARPAPAGAAVISAWTPVSGPPFPTGTPRRGWSMVVGRQRIVVPSAPRLTGDDKATAPYLVTVAPNANGVATGAARDTAHFVAELRKADGGWHVTSMKPVTPPGPAR